MMEITCLQTRYLTISAGESTWPSYREPVSDYAVCCRLLLPRDDI